tara:strand:- start:2244 stop:2390 length:147 start_codon:yes stop_codon:yes gene_type:complete
MSKKPTTKKEVAVKATSSQSSTRTVNGSVYTVTWGKNAKLGSKVDAKS